MTPDDVIIDAGDVDSGNGGPGEPGQGRRHPRRPRRRLRRRATSTSATPPSTASTCSRPTATARAVQGLLQRGVRRPHLHLGPRPDAGLRRRRQRRLRPLPGRRPGDRRADRRGDTSATTPRSASATCTTAPPATRARTRTRSGCTTTTSTTTRNGFTTDVFTAAGHPGFPQDSDLIENNEFYSNNFNPYLPELRRRADASPMPVGTGMWIAGGNNNVIRNNRFWDNWRRGTMLFAVPDAFVCGDPGPGDDQIPGCDPVARGRPHLLPQPLPRQQDGQAPDGQRRSERARLLVGPAGDRSRPPSNTGNCWFDNTGKDGTAASVTGSRPTGVPPDNLPSDCANAARLPAARRADRSS